MIIARADPYLGARRRNGGRAWRSPEELVSLALRRAGVSGRVIAAAVRASKRAAAPEVSFGRFINDGFVDRTTFR